MTARPGRPRKAAGGYHAADRFSALADPTRRHLLERLAQSDLAVAELTAGVSVSQAAVSQHLRILREAGLVSCRRDGRHSYYRITPGALTELRDWLDALDRFSARCCRLPRQRQQRWHDRTGPQCPSAQRRRNTMAVTAVEVISVPVSDQDRAKRFYAEVLGFTAVMDSAFGDDGSMRWVMLRPPAGGSAITLVTWFPELPAGSLRGTVLGCDDIEQTAAGLRQRGLAFNESEIAEAPWGRWLTFADPDGNAWVLQQTSPQPAG